MDGCVGRSEELKYLEGVYEKVPVACAICGRRHLGKTTLLRAFCADKPHIYLTGDGGYGRHFRQIASEFPRIDLAIVEDGQYNVDWAGIHLLPCAWKSAVAELRPLCVMPCHNAKYDLSRHTWQAPLEAALANAVELKTTLATPIIGTAIALDNPAAETGPWWRGLR